MMSRLELKTNKKLVKILHHNCSFVSFMFKLHTLWCKLHWDLLVVFFLVFYGCHMLQYCSAELKIGKRPRLRKNNGKFLDLDLLWYFSMIHFLHYIYLNRLFFQHLLMNFLLVFLSLQFWLFGWKIFWSILHHFKQNKLNVTTFSINF